MFLTLKFFCREAPPRRFRPAIDGALQRFAALERFTTTVMPGLVPGIHALLCGQTKDVDARDKRGHDG
jgi:hypothetical protein